MSKFGSVDSDARIRCNPKEIEDSWNASLETAIIRSPWRAFLVLSIIYFFVVFSLSSHKLLWLDELITLHIARLGSAKAIWDALQRGADPNPPVTHLLVHFSRKLLGDHEYAYRLPAAVGYWVGLFSLFAYLKPRLPAVWALAGTVLSMTMAAFEYSYESRSYGIFYGLAMLAFFCWTRAVDLHRSGRERTTFLAGMILALAAGISTNYFAVLAFLPIAGGEALRSILLARRETGGRLSFRSLARSFDLRIGCGLVIASTPLLAYRSLIAHSIAQFAPYAWNKVSLDQAFDSYTEMVEVVLFPILGLFIFALAVFWISRFARNLCVECNQRLTPRWLSRLSAEDASKLYLPAHEIFGVLLLMAYPFLGYLVASIRGGMLSPRFVIPVCFGFAIAATWIAYRLFGGFRRAGLAFLCFVSAWFLCREAVIAYWYEEQKQCFYKVLDHLPEAERQVPADAPIAIPDPLLALTFQHYAPPQQASRVVFPVDFPAIRHYRGDDSPEENLWAGRNFLYTLPIMPVARFLDSTGEYLVIAGDGNWLLQDLSHHRYPVKRLPINTRAVAIGGFTPLAHGTPVFYTALGERSIPHAAPGEGRPTPF